MDREQYFLIYELESGTKIKFLEDAYAVKKYLKEYFDEGDFRFIDDLTINKPYQYNRDHYNLLLIKGKCIIPRAVEIVKTYEID